MYKNIINYFSVYLMIIYVDIILAETTSLFTMTIKNIYFTC